MPRREKDEVFMGTSEQLRQKRGGPTPVRRRMDNYARLRNDPNAPSARTLYAGENEKAGNRRFRYHELARQQLLDPQRNAQAGRIINRPNLTDPEKLTASAVQAVSGVRPQGAVAGPADPNQFFGTAQGPLLADNREGLRAMGPEGQATLDYLEGQLNTFQNEYANMLARNNNPNLTEEELINRVQNMESYTPELQADISRFVESNLPKALQLQREEDAKFRRTSEREAGAIRETARQETYNTLNAIMGGQVEDLESYWEEAQRNPDLMDALVERAARAGRTLVDDFGNPVPLSLDLKSRLQKEYGTDVELAGKKDVAAAEQEMEEASFEKKWQNFFSKSEMDPEDRRQYQELMNAGFDVKEAVETLYQRKKEATEMREKQQKTEETAAAKEKEKIFNDRDKYFQANKNEIFARLPQVFPLNENIKDENKRYEYQSRQIAFSQDLINNLKNIRGASSGSNWREDFVEKHQDFLRDPYSYDPENKSAGKTWFEKFGIRLKKGKVEIDDAKGFDNYLDFFHRKLYEMQTQQSGLEGSAGPQGEAGPVGITDSTQTTSTPVAGEQYNREIGPRNSSFPFTMSRLGDGPTDPGSYPQVQNQRDNPTVRDKDTDARFEAQQKRFVEDIKSGLIEVDDEEYKAFKEAYKEYRKLPRRGKLSTAEERRELRKEYEKKQQQELLDRFGIEGAENLTHEQQNELLFLAQLAQQKARRGAAQ